MFETTVQGIDIAHDSICYAREKLKLDVVSGDFSTYDPDSDFDVVCMRDTIEHLTDPASCFGKISRNMIEGGLVALTTGDIGSLNARLRKGKRRLIHRSPHMHFFQTNINQTSRPKRIRPGLLRTCGLFPRC